MSTPRFDLKGRVNFKADTQITRRTVLAYRSRKASVLRSLQESVNFHRSLLSLRPHNYALPASSQPRSGPEFPPHDELILMSAEELHAWQRRRRNERVNLKHQEKSREHNAMVQELREELADLKRRVEDRNRREAEDRRARELAAASLMSLSSTKVRVVHGETATSPAFVSAEPSSAEIDPESNSMLVSPTNSFERDQNYEENLDYAFAEVENDHL